MLRKFLAAIFGGVICILLNACAPTSQASILDDNASKATEQVNICKDVTPTIAKVNCVFDGEHSVLEEAGFEDMDLLEIERATVLVIAEQYNAKQITGAEARNRKKMADDEFVSEVRQRDAQKMQEHQRTMMALAIAANSLAAPSYQPIISTPAPIYNSPPPASLPTNITFTPNYSDQTQNKVPSSPAQRLLACGQTSTCAGAFAIGQ